MRRDFPPWEDLPHDEQAAINNGVGPAWVPASWRAALTRWSGWFFEEASWAHHDYGYHRGGTPVDRFRCDWLFLQAMKRDACEHLLHRRLIALSMAVIYYASVRAFGCFSFNYTPDIGRH